jgi:hypothetical protein
MTVVLRPFIRHQMGSVILMQGGGAAGSTFVGDNKFDIEEDARSARYYGNMTFYSKSVVSEPKAVHVVRNFFAGAYISGCSTGTLNFNKRDQRLRGDMLQVKLPGWVEPPSGSFDMCKATPAEGDDIAGWSEGGLVYNFLMGWITLGPREEHVGMIAQAGSELGRSGEYTSACNDGWAAPGARKPANTVVYRGTHELKGDLVPGCGHWAELTGEGMAPLRSGVPSSNERSAKFMRAR